MVAAADGRLVIAAADGRLRLLRLMAGLRGDRDACTAVCAGPITQFNQCTLYCTERPSALASECQRMRKYLVLLGEMIQMRPSYACFLWPLVFSGSLFPCDLCLLYVRHTPEQQVCILNTTYKGKKFELDPVFRYLPLVCCVEDADMLLWSMSYIHSP